MVETKNNEGLHFCTTEIYVPQEYFRMCYIRLSEHKSSAASSKSAVREHVVRSGGHNIDWTGVKVLERESKDFSRRVLEAIQIKSKGPNLNRDKGLDLDPVWDTLLQKRGGAK